jgi:hypothetical protein
MAFSSGRMRVGSRPTHIAIVGRASLRWLYDIEIQVRNTHLSDLSALDGEIVVSFEVVQRLSELYFYVFQGFIFLYPLGQFPFHVLSVQVSPLIDLLFSLVVEIDDLPSTVRTKTESLTVIRSCSSGLHAFQINYATL